MKKHISLIGVALLSLSSIQASSTSVAAPKAAEKQPVEKIVPRILFQKGQQEDSWAATFTASYLGGYALKNDLQVAQDGLATVRTAAGPSQGKPLYADANWCNGFMVEMTFSTGEMDKSGHLFGAMYAGVTSNNSTKTTTAAAGVNSIAPSFSTDNLGAFALQNKASGLYNMPWFQHGYFFYSHGGFVNRSATVSVRPFAAIHALGLNHSLAATYTNAASTVTEFNFKELNYGAGPAAGTEVRMLLTPNFAFSAMVFASAPVLNNRVTQSDAQTVVGLATTQGLNTSGSQVRQSYAGLVNIDAVYLWKLEGCEVEFGVGWIGQQHLQISRLMQAATIQGGASSTFAVNLLKGTIGFRF